PDPGPGGMPADEISEAGPDGGADPGPGQRSFRSRRVTLRGTARKERDEDGQLTQALYPRAEDAEEGRGLHRDSPVVGHVVGEQDGFSNGRNATQRPCAGRERRTCVSDG